MQSYVKIIIKILFIIFTESAHLQPTQFGSVNSLVLGRLIDSSINNRLSVMLSDYRIVRSVIDESSAK